MAKKYQHREHVSVRKKREEEQKLQKRQEFYAAHKKQMIAGVVAAIVAVVLIWAAVDYFYTPGGSIRMFMGKLIGVEDSWIVRNLGTTKHPLYFKFGEVETPEGYTLDADYSVSSDKTEQSFYFNADDENAVIQSVYYAGVKEKTSQEMLETVRTSGIYTSVTETKEVQLGGVPMHYVYAQMNPDSNDASVFSAMLLMYADTVKDSCVLMNCNSAHLPQEQLPSEEEMLAAAERLAACLKLPE